ncbi:hypothetical protein FGE12_19135 [Aggregicoccus sp. 17bor-14]|uniref:DUF7919 family protein n=1 Tax=Myxococcaceae TaxID=31 RepID=UPI00129C9C2D|nr:MULTISPECIES: hypothetical protein [Myxococcaceae]MBF5044521.1 hypothetical protein [Simulacricoccus sp. 17bor-14]MRI90266.1 hypothetical protein [Aggregicoccus sp. 17bor-14]
MHFVDLSPYSYALPRSLPRVLNVGWLSAAHSFPVGEPPSGFAERLRRCVVECSVNRMRGVHACELCGDPMARQSVVIDSREVWLGSSEVWLPAPGGGALAAPDLVIHYVEAHDYLPPAVFVDAVMCWDARSGWNPEAVFEAKTLAAFESEPTHD